MRREFIYTQTRLQARHGLRPDERSWQVAESQRELGNFLQSARQAGLKGWVSGLQPSDSNQLLETALLKLYRDYIDDIASWVPRGWRESVEWTKILTYLPPLLHLIKGNTAQAWMLQDPVLKPFTAIHHDQRNAALLQSEYAPMVHAYHDGLPLLGAWTARWQKLWPGPRAGDRAGLEHLQNLLQQHLVSFAQAASETAWQQRQQLAARVGTLFRAFRYQPAAIFCHLLLVALDVERLRGDILQRRLFPSYREDSA
jgi:hypothetical protein